MKLQHDTHIIKHEPQYILPAVIAAEKPDLIVFTGDAINSPAGLPIFRELMEKLAKIAPTFVVAGNWDTSFFKSSDRFTGTGVIELVNEPAVMTVRGIDVRIAAEKPMGYTDVA